MRFPCDFSFEVQVTTGMKRHLISTAIGLLCCVASGCSSPTSPIDEQALSRAEARWASRAFDSYSYNTVTSCGLCFSDRARQTRVEVRGGKVSAAIVVANDSLLPTATSFPTVDGMFAQIRGYTRDAGVREVRVQYDPQLGYPTSINVFAKAGIMDGDYGTSVSNLVPTP